MTGEPALELQRIVKRFGSIPAIDGVDTVSYTHLTLPTTPYV